MKNEKACADATVTRIRVKITRLITFSLEVRPELHGRIHCSYVNFINIIAEK
ncbi:MAG: hypothetical protein WBG50_11545 [Desulfomonilaceae bacterium]